MLRLVVLSPVYDGRYRAVHFSVFLSWVPLALASAADPLALHCLFSLIIQRVSFFLALLSIVVLVADLLDVTTECRTGRVSKLQYEAT